MRKKAAKKEFFQRLMWACIGYLSSLYGIVDLPVQDAANLLL